MRVENFKVPGGEEETIAIANREVTRLKQQITYLVKDGLSFPALQEIERLQTLPDPNGVFKDLARAQARVKVDEITKIISELEAACSNLAATVITLGEGLNDDADLEAVVGDIQSTEEAYVKKARAALCSLAAASGGEPPAVPLPPPPVPRPPEANKFTKISATAEPSNLPRDVTPSDFQLWLLKFNTFSSASWIPGPPTSGEKLRQLRVYLGTAWQDVTESIDFDTATFEEVIQYLTDEISIHYPVVRRRIELFSIPDQMHAEGPWEYWRRVVAKCKNGALGSRETGLSLTYDQFLITLFLKGLKESDREKIQSKYMNYEATYSEMEEVAKSLEQSSVSLKARPGKSKGMVNAVNTEEGCKLFVYGIQENISDSELQGEFGKFGNVTDTYNTGKGYAFVTFDSKESAAEATEQLNGQTLFGQQIKVNEARPKQGGGGGGGYGAPEQEEA